MSQTKQGLVENARKQMTETKPKEARKRIGQGAVVLDVRDDHEYDDGHLPGAGHITRGMLEFEVADHPATKNPDTELVLYCKASGRAALAAQTLQQMGYTNVLPIEGGYQDWVAGGEESEDPGRDEEE